ncbi:MAG: amidohydrolase family protein [Anaerolineae bacterium]
MVESMSLAERVWSGQSLDGLLVLDAHAHIGEFKDYVVPQPEAAQLVAYMDRYGIQRASIFAFAGVSSDFEWGNDLVIDAVKAFPERFVGYTTLNANYPEELIPELERTFARGLRGIKLITGYQGQPEETERFLPVYEWANARKVIILSHQWGAADFLDRIATQYPRISFHIGHLNAHYAKVVRKHDNVYTTTTFVPWPGAIASAVQTFGAEKILFGTDFPDLDASLNVGPLLTAHISDDDKLKILGGNLQRIYEDYGLV